MSNRESGDPALDPAQPPERPPAATPSLATPRVWPSALCGLAMAATACLFRPLESALTNWSEIDLTLYELLVELTPWFLLTALVLAGAAALATRLLGPGASAIVAAGTLALFVQGTFLAFDYGPFDGRSIDWQAHWPEALAEFAVWGGLLGLALARPRLLRAGATAIAVLTFGAGSVLIASATVPRAKRIRDATPPALGAEVVTSFSQTSNVIVVVLDMFQSDFFVEAMEDPALAEAMPPGFVFHRNAVAMYPSTRLSLQSILTSRALDLTRPLGAWRAETMRESIAAELSRSGYQSSLLTFSPQNLSCERARYGYTCLTPEHLVALARGTGSTASARARQRAARTMLATGLFRLAPWILKPAIYDEGHWQLAFVDGPLDSADHVASESDSHDPRIPRRARSDLAVYDVLLRSMDAANSRPTFRLIHLFATHFPNFLDAECSLAKAIGGRARSETERWERRRIRAIWTARCALSRLYAFLQRLDDIGAYDASLIFVVADHGHPKIPLSIGSIGSTGPPLPKARDSGEMPGAEAPPGGVPLFLVKRPGDRGPLRISDAPVSLCDVPASIADALDRRSDGFDCHSVFAAPGLRPRPRDHFRVEASARERPPYRTTRWIVDGHSWRASSWQMSPLP